MDFHIDDSAVFAPVPPVGGRLQLRSGLVYVFKQSWDVLFGTNMGYFHVQEFFARIAVLFGGGFVDLQEVQRL